ncbi:transposase [Streptomyces sp. MspMP-M5]|uniref:transposase n=1 Tax=Streptomyces sp. MspMP-M5 TaxID=1155718 RepID=UPI00039C9F8C|nr:hypothetical protein [Streptomyces sp. SID8354]
MTEFQEADYTIVGDHLTQHHELSLGAIGLAVYILSLPEGSQVDIHSLSKRFPEGRERIASGLRELERHGYLKRVTRRLDDGRLVTPPRPPRGDAPRRSPAPRPPLPRPRSPQHLTTATALLANLRRDDARLLLPVGDIDRLAPCVAAWLERGVSPEAVRRALSADLPDPVRSPAGLIAHRLISRVLREEFPHLKSRMPTLWSSSFFLASVGAVSADTVEKYINTQWERPWAKEQEEGKA